MKSVKRIPPIHELQILTYMKLARAKVGRLTNFNVERFRDSIKSMVLRGHLNCAGVAGRRTLASAHRSLLRKDAMRAAARVLVRKGGQPRVNTDGHGCSCGRGSAEGLASIGVHQWFMANAQRPSRTGRAACFAVRLNEQDGDSQHQRASIRNNRPSPASKDS